MKVKTSITLSADLLKRLDGVLKAGGNRSAIVEEALRDYLLNRTRLARDANDRKILDRLADDLNEEALDVLEYQVDV